MEILCIYVNIHLYMNVCICSLSRMMTCKKHEFLLYSTLIPISSVIVKINSPLTLEVICQTKLHKLQVNNLNGLVQVWIFIGNLGYVNNSIEASKFSNDLSSRLPNQIGPHESIANCYLYRLLLLYFNSFLAT